ncbi:MAG TPA: lipid A biosynthesis acyltransferase [Cellvibrio sp.]|nr:lipid A biosynthesis acyltransferase [Cellvibrio sp.]
MRASTLDKHNPPEFHSSFYGPRFWPTWLLLAFFRLCALLPVSVNFAIGRFIGAIFYYLARSRRRIAATNIALCFPELDAQSQQQMVRAVVRNCGISIMESSMALWGQVDKLRNRHHMEGFEQLAALQANGQGVILLGCHFTTMDPAGRVFSYHAKPDMLYRKDPNPLLAYALIKAREQYLGSAIVFSDTRQLIKNLRQKHIVWYAPDQDYGKDNSVFAPFFGIQAATIVATARIAQLGRAAVVPYAHYREDNGHYKLVFGAPLDNFPSGDDVADATRINNIIEDMVRVKPDQYLWVHRRFKTRPPGESGFYKKK